MSNVADRAELLRRLEKTETQVSLSLSLSNTHTHTHTCSLYTVQGTGEQFNATSIRMGQDKAKRKENREDDQMGPGKSNFTHAGI